MLVFFYLILLISSFGYGMDSRPDLKIDIPSNHSRTTSFNIIACNDQGCNLVDIKDIDKEELVKVALNLYFKENYRSHHQIIPTLGRRLQQAMDSPHPRDHEAIRALKNIMEGQSVANNNENIRCLYELILDTTRETMSNLEKESYSYQKKSKSKVDKKTLITTNLITNIITAILGVVTTLVVHFTNQC